MDQENNLANQEDHIHQVANMEITSHELTYSSPLPPPAVLEQYEKIVPGSAAKIIDAASKQGEHRQELEAKVIHWDILNSRLGLVFGLTIGLAGLVAAVMIAKSGQQTASSIIGGGTLVALVGSFVYGSQGKNYEQSKEDNNQNQENN